MDVDSDMVGNRRLGGRSSTGSYMRRKLIYRSTLPDRRKGVHALVEFDS